MSSVDLIREGMIIIINTDGAEPTWLLLITKVDPTLSDNKYTCLGARCNSKSNYSSNSTEIFTTLSADDIRHYIEDADSKVFYAQQTKRVHTYVHYPSTWSKS